MLTFVNHEKESLRKKNFWEKRENAGKYHFLLFPDVFYPINYKLQHFSHIGIFVCNAFDVDKAKFYHLIESENRGSFFVKNLCLHFLTGRNRE